MARATLMLVAVFLFGALSSRGASAQTVLFDNSHGERFVIRDQGPLQLSGLADIFTAKGVKVATLDRGITDAALAGADGLVISGPFAPLSPDELDALVRFMNRGGKVAVMLHIAPPLVSLLDRLGISYTNGVIEETENVIGKESHNFRSTRLGNHPVMQGLKEFSLYGVWGLRNMGDRARIVASSSPNAWIDLYREKVQRKENTASFGVAVAGEVGSGGFLVFGDDAIFQNKFLDENNRALAANLANWLK